MELQKTRYSRSINLLFVLIIALGVGISTVVYVRGDKITQITLELVDKEIPTFELFERLDASMVQQERYLYEFYATEEHRLYLRGFKDAEEKSYHYLQQLIDRFGPIEQLTSTKQDLDSINETAEAFFTSLSQVRDWDLAREHLVDISGYRRHALPHTIKLRELAKQRVETLQAEVEKQSYYVKAFVIVYGLVTLLIAFVVARSVQSALANSAISQRLALFPTRNPNPIISIDINNKVTFANPATDKLIAALARPQKDYDYLLSEELCEFKYKVKDGEQDHIRFEYTIDKMIFDSELHWLEDQQQWDLHLSEITAQKEAETQLLFQAFHHPETGLSNQYELKEHLDKYCAENNLFALTIVQIKGFADLVRGRGFEAAQMVVNQVGESLKRIKDTSSPKNTHLYHVSDNNFVVLVTGHNANEATLTFIKDTELLIASSLFHCQHQPELEFGITIFPDHGSNAETLLHNARVAMDANNGLQGRNYRFFDLDLGQHVAHEQQLEDDLRAATNRQEFELHFQPQYSLEQQLLIGAETLIRWNNNGKPVSPAEFIPIAEKSGLIVPLGQWILQTACETAKSILDMGFPNFVMAVNISPRQFGRDDFVDVVRQALENAQLPPDNLELEITEGVIMHNEVDTIARLKALKNLGVQLSIDDFGTGYSSLSYLKQFPVDKLKIDQSFVKEMHNNADDQSIVKAIVDLGSTLHLKLIAEGVEEQAHIELLDEFGCHEIQGYFYSKPLPLSDLNVFLNKSRNDKSFSGH